MNWQNQSGFPILIGPKDCRALPEWFGGKSEPVDLDQHDIEIVAELNHAPRFSIDEIISAARQLKADGADIIDFGCDPSQRCTEIADYIVALVDQGMAVSVDTFDPWEAEQATLHGAGWFFRSIPKAGNTPMTGAPRLSRYLMPLEMISFHETIDFLQRKNIPHRLDPILEPIGTGFVGSLMRMARPVRSTLTTRC